MRKEILMQIICRYATGTL